MRAVGLVVRQAAVPALQFTEGSPAVPLTLGLRPRAVAAKFLGVQICAGLVRRRHIRRRATGAPLDVEF